MKAIADCLTQTGISYPLVQLRTLFQRFLGLSQGFFGDEGNMHSLESLGSLSYPANSFSVSWEPDSSFNHILFSGAEIFSGVLVMSDNDLWSYGDTL